MNRSFAVGLSTILFCAGAFAQVAGMGGIFGIVRDASGAAVPDAQVIVSNESKGIKRVIHTTDAGVFAAPSLVPASGYVVNVTKQGFATYDVKDIQLQVGQVVDLTVLHAFLANSQVSATTAAE